MSLSLRSKLIIGTLVILLVIISALTIVLARNAATLLEKESSNQLSQLLEQSTGILSSFLQARSANLELWAAEPLIHSVANDPALEAIFSLGLRYYFDNYTAKEPWIENILLTKNGTVIYAHADAFPVLAENSTTVEERLSQWLSPSSEDTPVFDLDVLVSDNDQGVVVMKRQLTGETGLMEGAFVLLVLNLNEVQQALFSTVKAGTNGFLSVAAQLSKSTNTSVLWIPSQDVSSEPERVDFLTAYRHDLLLSEYPRQYQSIIIDHRKLLNTPLVIVGVAALRDVREPVQRLIYFAIACGSLAIVAGIISVFFFSSRFTAPIRELTTKAHEVASARLGQHQLQSASSQPEVTAEADEKTNLSAQIFDNINSRDEVEELASVFQLLDQRTAELEQANTLLDRRNREIDQAMRALEEVQREQVINLQRLEKELAAARHLQLSMVPSVYPAPSIARPVDIYALMEPAREVGGDLYDFFYADDYTLCFAIGDVSDKGTSAALFMARARSLIRLAVNQWLEATGKIPEVSQIMRAVNRELCQNNDTRMFVTLFLGLLDVRSGIVECANGGHVIPFRLEVKGTASVIDSGRPDVPLGVNQHSDYRSIVLRLQSQEMLLLYTDGISEAMNSDGQFYSSERLRLQLLNLCTATPKEIITKVKHQVDEFVGQAPQSDDVTLLALRWCPAENDD